MFRMHKKSTDIPSAEEALPGRPDPLPVGATHFVNGNSIKPPFAPSLSQAMFGMGCFWGAEKRFWQLRGVHATAVGYAGGYTPNPTYDEVCTGMTGHNEVVLVVFDPAVITYEELLKVFWQSHDPTQGMRQGNDIGTQYRSGIYAFSAEQRAVARSSAAVYQAALGDDRPITSEIIDAPPFFYAETYHQQYLAKNPNGYCGLGGLGVAFPSTG